MFKLACCGVSALALGAAVPASAAHYTATFTGTFAGAGDFAGLFGTTIDITGQAFAATFRVETAVPGTLAFTALNSHFFYSGPYYGGLPTAMSATLTSNGHSVAMIGNIGGMIWQENDTTPLGTSGNGDYIDYVLNGAGPGSRTASLSFQIADGTTDILPTDDYAAPGHYHFGATTLMDNRFAIYDGNQPLSYGYLHATDLIVSGGVPEPASWALLMSGFGLVGMALRHRSQVHSAAEPGQPMGRIA